MRRVGWCILMLSAVCAGAARGGAARAAVVIPLRGRIDEFMVEAFETRLREAKAQFDAERARRRDRDADRLDEGEPIRKAATPELVLLDLHVTGGAAGATVRIADAVHDLSRRDYGTAALVHGPGSAPATLIALACQDVFLAEKARLVPLAPDRFDPKPTEKEEKQFLDSLRRYCGDRPRLEALYVAFADPATEVHAVVFEGRGGQPAFYDAAGFKRVRASDQPILRSERVVARGRRAELAAAAAQRIGLAEGIVQTAGEAATALKVPGKALTTLNAAGEATKPTTATASKPAEPDERPKKAQLGPVGDGDTVAVITITGMVGYGMQHSVERRLAEAQAMDPALIVLEFNTPGGRLDSAYGISDKIFDIKAPRTVAYINDEAISAGSFIAVACDEIVMHDGSTMGDCQIVAGGEPVKLEKYESPLRAQFRKYCEGKYPIALAMAMVTEDIEVHECITPEGTKEYLTGQEFGNLTAAERDRYTRTRRVVTKDRLLTMTHTEARDFGFAKAVVSSRQDILDLYGLGDRGVTIEVLDWTWSEKFVRYLDYVAPVILMLGMLGIIIELKTPGFGVFGIVGLALVGVFFFGKYTAGLAEVWEIALFVVGVALLAGELFVTPGFGLLGVSGILCMVASLVLSLQSFGWPANPFEWQVFERNLATVGAVVVGTFVALVIVARHLHKAPYVGRLVLATPPSSTDETEVTRSVTPGPSAEAEESRAESLVGRRGQARSMLRPAGMAEVDGEPLNVVTEGDYINPGEPIEIVQVRGNRIVVKRAR
ncbi:MAG: NfeD family protein [Planctomycetota bacterium]